MSLEIYHPFISVQEHAQFDTLTRKLEANHPPIIWEVSQDDLEGMGYNTQNSCGPGDITEWIESVGTISHRLQVRLCNVKIDLTNMVAEAALQAKSAGQNISNLTPEAINIAAKKLVGSPTIDNKGHVISEYGDTITFEGDHDTNTITIQGPDGFSVKISGQTESVANLIGSSVAVRSPMPKFNLEDIPEPPQPDVIADWIIKNPSEINAALIVFFTLLPFTIAVELKTKIYYRLANLGTRLNAIPPALGLTEDFLGKSTITTLPQKKFAASRKVLKPRYPRQSLDLENVTANYLPEHQKKLEEMGLNSPDLYNEKTGLPRRQRH